jgi:hypothetical protein
VHRAVHDDALPVKDPAYLVNLEGHPTMMKEGGDLGTGTRAAVQPTARVHVMHWLDVDTVVEGERHPSDIIPLEELIALLAR